MGLHSHVSIPIFPFPCFHSYMYIPIPMFSFLYPHSFTILYFLSYGSIPMFPFIYLYSYGSIPMLCSHSHISIPMCPFLQNVCSKIMRKLLMPFPTGPGTILISSCLKITQRNTTSSKDHRYVLLIVTSTKPVTIIRI